MCSHVLCWVFFAANAVCWIRALQWILAVFVRVWTVVDPDRRRAARAVHRVEELFSSCPPGALAFPRPAAELSLPRSQLDAQGTTTDS